MSRTGRAGPWRTRVCAALRSASRGPGELAERLSAPLLQILFELLNVPSVLLADQLEMSLYSSGLLSGVVVDSGCGLTRVQPFHLGRPLRPGATTLEFAGQDLSVYLFKSLFKEDYNRHNLFQLDTVASTQMRKCYVPQNLGDELDFYQNLPDGADERNSYHLPDGTAVELTPMQRLAPEMFFSPQVFGLQGPSLAQAAMDSIEACEASLRPLLASHVAPCGGNTLYPGFTMRLYQLLASHFFPTKASVFAGSNRHFSVWLGASVVAHLSTYKSEWLTKEEYDERFRL